jgi:hypothetical protein
MAGLTGSTQYINGVLVGPASAGGWTDDGGTVRLTTVTDQVVIGALVPVGAEAFRVVGLTRVEGRFDLIGPGGANNTFAGLNAGLSIAVGGTDNSAFGANALGALTTGDGNTAIGSGALDSTTTQSNNTAVGLNALGAATNTGAQNTAVGSGALDANTTASDNTAVGYNALGANTTGTRNTAYGSGALGANTTSNSSTAVGYHALLLSTGANNVAIGDICGDAITSGSSNTAVGQEALTTLTTGTSNVAIGTDALALLQTGSNNVAVGLQALLNATTVSGCTAVGDHAAKTLTQNPVTAVGYQALLNVLAGDNTAVGYQAGDSIVGGTGGVFFGARADASDPDLSNHGAIGVDAVVDKSNVIVIGKAGTFLGINDSVSLIGRPSAGILLVTGNPDIAQQTAAAALRQAGGNGSWLSRGVFNEELTILAAATTDSAFSFAATTVILAVAVYVTVVIPAPATTFNVTLTSDGTQLSNSTAISVAAGSNDKGTAAGAHLVGGAGSQVRITPNSNPAAATGKVRIVGWSYSVQVPTS